MRSCTTPSEASAPSRSWPVDAEKALNAAAPAGEPAAHPAAASTASASTPRTRHRTTDRAAFMSLPPLNAPWRLHAKDGKRHAPVDGQQPQHHHHGHPRPGRPRAPEPDRLQDQVEGDARDGGGGVDIAAQDEPDLGADDIAQDAARDSGHG